ARTGSRPESRRPAVPRRERLAAPGALGRRGPREPASEVRRGPGTAATSDAAPRRRYGGGVGDPLGPVRAHRCGTRPPEQRPELSAGALVSARLAYLGGAACAGEPDFDDCGRSAITARATTDVRRTP